MLLSVRGHAAATSGISTRFNPAFFRHLEKRVGQLRELGIEADLILFHPYDKGHWGFDRMDAAADDRYLRYVVARLAAYRNVWWSLANEYDFMKDEDGGRLGPVFPDRAGERSLRPPALDPQRHASSTTTRSRGSRTPASRTARRSRTPAAPCSTATSIASRSSTTR